jgi:multidrug resistance efflux pump
MNKGKAPSQSEQQDSAEAQQQAEIEQLQSQVAGMQASALSAQGQTPYTSSQDRISQLKELAELKEAGVLTEEEFQQEKARILSS